MNEKTLTKKEEFEQTCQELMNDYQTNHQLSIIYVRKRKVKISAKPNRAQMAQFKSGNTEGLAENVIRSARSIIKSRQSAPVGVVVRFVRDGENYIGWSLCNQKAGDEFNRHIGIYYAIRRAKTLAEVSKNTNLLPHSVKKTVEQLLSPKTR